MIVPIIITILCFSCIHDSVQSRVNIRRLKIPPDPGLFFSTNELRKPIRLIFDVSSLTDMDDTSICRNVGQTVFWGGRDDICTKDDIMSDNKYNTLYHTLLAVNRYITSVLNLTRMTAGFYLQNLTDITLKPQYVECDLFVSVTVRPFGARTSTIATAFYEITEPMLGRPIQGGIIVNVANIPASPQNETTFDRLFFTTLLHELVHTLGVSYRAIPSWINPNTQMPYDQLPVIEYSLTKYPHKIFRILQTQSSHKFAVERFGREYFAPDVLSGIELEDGGGVGTFGSHPEARVYIDDMFVGSSIGQNHISKLVFALLEDTGWYDVSYHKAEKMAWGDGESLNDKPLTNFPVVAPQNSYPKHYICDPNYMDTDVCTYDFLGIALCKGVKVDCNFPADENDQKFCEMKNFTDPLNIGYRGKSEIHDYLLYKAPYANSRCADMTRNNDNALKNGELYGGESLCYMSTLLRSSFSFYTYHHGACYRTICSINGSLTVFVDNVGKECERENQILTFPGFKGEIVCPNPSHVCGIRKMYGILGPIPTMSPSDPTQLWEGIILNTVQIIIISVFSCFVLAVIIISMVIQVKRRAQKSSSLK